MHREMLMQCQHPRRAAGKSLLPKSKAYIIHTSLPKQPETFSDIDILSLGHETPPEWADWCHQRLG